MVWLAGGWRLWKGYQEQRERQVLMHALGKGVPKIENEYGYNNCFYLQWNSAGWEVLLWG